MSISTDSKSTSASVLQSLLHWFDSHAQHKSSNSGKGQKEIDWLRVIPFIGMHVGCLAVLLVGWSVAAVLVAIGLYVTRMLAVTGFYHRYFSHKSFKTSRPMQFLFALLGATAVQRGPLWWASHHRHHHLHSDQEEDAHSPRQHGFWWSHVGWIVSKQNFAPKFDRVPDLVKFKELVWLDRFDALIPIVLSTGLYVAGAALEIYFPEWQTNGAQLLVWGFFISTVVLYHATYTVNSLAHKIGRRRYKTKDDSRNSLLIALITCGEGWHNNHHHYPGSVRQGFFWWEVDLTYYFLKLLSALGLIWDLKTVPDQFKRLRLNCKGAE